MPPLLLKIGSPILLIGGLIFIHELGHFLVAKLFRVKVLRFSVGFGPRLFGFTRGDTEYRLAAIPLGGYVKMAGEDPAEVLAPEDRGRGFHEQAPWKRSLIALAGPGMNLVFPVLIYFCVFYFQTQGLSTRVGSVDPDSPAASAGLRPGDRILAVDGQAVRYFNDLRDAVGPKYDRQVHLEVERTDGTRFEADAVPRKVVEKDLFHETARGILGVGARQPGPVIGVNDPSSAAARAGLRSFDRLTRVAGQPVHVLADVEQLLASQRGPFEVSYLRAEPLPTPGAALSTAVERRATVVPVQVGGKWATGIEGVERLVRRVAPGSPAASAGLRPGDEIVSADGTPVHGWATLERVRSEAKDHPIALDVLRDGKPIHLTVAQSYVSQEDELGRPVRSLYFGAQPDTTDEPGELVPLHFSAWYALGQAARIVPQTIGEVVQVFWGIVSGTVAFKAMGGPGMLYDIATKSAEAGWDAFLSAMAAISINLGVLNLVPVPVLDGFHVLSAGVEGIRRRPLSLRAREVANMVGLGMLLLLMVFVLKNDFVRYVLN